MTLIHRYLCYTLGPGTVLLASCPFISFTVWVSFVQNKVVQQKKATPISSIESRSPVHTSTWVSRCLFKETCTCFFFSSVFNIYVPDNAVKIYVSYLWLKQICSSLNKQPLIHTTLQSFCLFSSLDCLSLQYCKGRSLWNMKGWVTKYSSKGWYAGGLHLSPRTFRQR